MKKPNKYIQKLIEEETKAVLQEGPMEDLQAFRKRQMGARYERNAVRTVAGFINRLTSNGFLPEASLKTWIDSLKTGWTASRKIQAGEQKEAQTAAAAEAKAVAAPAEDAAAKISNRSPSTNIRSGLNSLIASANPIIASPTDLVMDDGVSAANNISIFLSIGKPSSSISL